MSKTTETNLWGIHAGKTGDADSLFLRKSCVAVGWTKMGDLASLKPDRVTNASPTKGVRNG